MAKRYRAAEHLAAIEDDGAFDPPLAPRSRFHELMREHLRLSILTVCVMFREGGLPPASVALLGHALSHLGFRPSHAELVDELCWLSDRGLIRINEQRIGGRGGGARFSVIRATTTAVGRDVAAGRATAPGVHRRQEVRDAG